MRSRVRLGGVTLDHRLYLFRNATFDPVGCNQPPQFNSLQPLGSLQYNYYLPLPSVAVDVGHNLTAKGGWNYYQYGEGSFVGPASPVISMPAMQRFLCGGPADFLLSPMEPEFSRGAEVPDPSTHTFVFG